MKLSDTTISLLKNFAAINPNLLFRQGSRITTIAEAKNIIAEASISETISKEFGVYDLNEFLSALSLLKAPELELGDRAVQMIDGGTTIDYVYSAPETLTVVEKSIKMPTADVSFTLTDAQLSSIKKAAAVFGHPAVSFTGKDGVIRANVYDPKNSASNRYSILIDEKNAFTKAFDFQFVIGNLKVISGDYTVSISAKLISQWSNTAADIKYYIAIEKASAGIQS